MINKNLEYINSDETISTKRPELTTVTLDDRNWENITVTTRQYTRYVYDEYMTGIYDPDDPYSNGLKTEDDFWIWQQALYSDVSVHGGIMKFHRTE